VRLSNNMAGPLANSVASKVVSIIYKVLLNRHNLVFAFLKNSRTQQKPSFPEVFSSRTTGPDRDVSVFSCLRVYTSVLIFVDLFVSYKGIRSVFNFNVNLESLLELAMASG